MDADGPGNDAKRMEELDLELARKLQEELDAEAGFQVRTRRMRQAPASTTQSMPSTAHGRDPAAGKGAPETSASAPAASVRFRSKPSQSAESPVKTEGRDAGPGSDGDSDGSADESEGAGQRDAAARRGHRKAAAQAAEKMRQQQTPEAPAAKPAASGASDGKEELGTRAAPAKPVSSKRAEAADSARGAQGEPVARADQPSASAGQPEGPPRGAGKKQAQGGKPRHRGDGKAASHPPGEGSGRVSCPVRANPMIRRDEYWYRCRVVSSSAERILVSWCGYDNVWSDEWLDRTSDRVWRGSHKGRHWEYMGGGAWRPKPRVYNKEPTRAGGRSKEGGTASTVDEGPGSHQPTLSGATPDGASDGEELGAAADAGTDAGEASERAGAQGTRRRAAGREGQPRAGGDRAGATAGGRPAEGQGAFEEGAGPPNVGSREDSQGGSAGRAGPARGRESRRGPAEGVAGAGAGREGRAPRGHSPRSRGVKRPAEDLNSDIWGERDAELDKPGVAGVVVTAEAAAVSIETRHPHQSADAEMSEGAARHPAAVEDGEEKGPAPGPAETRREVRGERVREADGARPAASGRAGDGPGGDGDVAMAANDADGRGGSEGSDGDQGGGDADADKRGEAEHEGGAEEGAGEEGEGDGGRTGHPKRVRRAKVMFSELEEAAPATAMGARKARKMGTGRGATGAADAGAARVPRGASRQGAAAEAMAALGVDDVGPTEVVEAGRGGGRGAGAARRRAGGGRWGAGKGDVAGAGVAAEGVGGSPTGGRGRWGERRGGRGGGRWGSRARAARAWDAEEGAEVAGGGVSEDEDDLAAVLVGMASAPMVDDKGRDWEGEGPESPATHELLGRGQSGRRHPGGRGLRDASGGFASHQPRGASRVSRHTDERTDVAAWEDPPAPSRHGVPGFRGMSAAPRRLPGVPQLMEELDQAEGPAIDHMVGPLARHHVAMVAAMSRDFKASESPLPATRVHAELLQCPAEAFRVDGAQMAQLVTPLMGPASGTLLQGSCSLRILFPPAPPVPPLPLFQH